MKFFFVAILISIIPFATYAQRSILQKKVSISFNDVELQKALTQLQNHSGVSIAFNNELPEMTDLVNGSFNEETIEFILTNLLHEKSIEFKIIGTQIALFKKKDNSTQRNLSNSISGIIVDEKTKEPLSYINIVIGNTSGTMSDNTGHFQMNNLLAGNYNISFSAIGYTQKEIDTIILTESQSYDLGIIYLTECAISLYEVVVSPGSYSILEKDVSTPVLALSAENIRNMAFAEDITRAVTRLPGISASDYTSRFAIRGGEADEVLISLDGMELYEPFHQRDYSGGLFNIVDIETVRGVDLMMGGFSAENGNRLSGVFRMKTKTINNDEKHTKIGLSVMQAQLYTDGKFAKNRGSYIVTARRGMLDLSLKALGNNEWFPKFYDALAKIEYKLNDKNFLSLHFLHSGDRAFIDNSPEADALERFHSKFYSTYGWMSLKSFYSDKLFSRSILYTGNINHLRTGALDKYEPTDKGTFTIDDRRDYSFAGIKQDWSWKTFEKLQFRFGFEAKKLWANYLYVNAIHELRVNENEELYNFDRDLDFSFKPKGEQIGFYINTRFNILPKLIAETGLRFDYSSYTNDKNWSPRASILYSVSKRTSIRAGWGYYYQSQFINNLDVNNGNNDFNSAELAKHYVVGVEHNFAKGINLRLEGYYKDYSNVSPLWTNLRDHLESYPEARNDLARIVFNGITSKGLELFIKYDKRKKISWWFGYALAQALDDIKDIEYNGMLIKPTGKVPRLNDQRHTIYADINYRPTKTWHFSASWQYYIGWPRTDYTYRYIVLPNDSLHFYAVHSGYNGTLYPAYHRLDVRVNKTFNIKHGTVKAYVLIINAYNRRNLKKYDLDSQNDSGEYSLDTNGKYIPFEDNKYWLGFLPVFGLNWEF